MLLAALPFPKLNPEKGFGSAGAAGAEAKENSGVDSDFIAASALVSFATAGSGAGAANENVVFGADPAAGEALLIAPFPKSDAPFELSLAFALDLLSF